MMKPEAPWSFLVISEAKIVQLNFLTVSPECGPGWLNWAWHNHRSCRLQLSFFSCPTMELTGALLKGLFISQNAVKEAMPSSSSGLVKCHLGEAWERMIGCVVWQPLSAALLAVSWPPTVSILHRTLIHTRISMGDSWYTVLYYTYINGHISMEDSPRIIMSRISDGLASFFTIASSSKQFLKDFNLVQLAFFTGLRMASATDITHHGKSGWWRQWIWLRGQNGKLWLEKRYWLIFMLVGNFVWTFRVKEKKMKLQYMSLRIRGKK